MTDKEAVMILECMATSLMEAWTGLSNKDPLTDVLDQRIKAIDVAQSALKEREKRARGCGYCTGVVLNVVDETTVFEAGFSYCPRCGRKLKEEPNGVDYRRG